ncbi:ATP-grasp fold amidoligase family protein [Clostridium perfringens]|uniref:ATP-grasp fold amidoligase family protein n=3 Tax=Clostridium perfringens TaxID=1502 RepID=UPI0011594264|nr:ATP-grasp fold amidoligase family protein [Clostridium perfringens]MDM0689100.1 ATP-grasp fold amidoligase family protein [Clostridium perfringens]MDU3376674.1 ATP-grasp fold amidoligase family protein [Clostridium perfringens]MDU3535894.1 ATP-grasp fold amidoligase family protein [Clostridium perfringens]HAT4114047.1 glycosyl transferase [Clostridium perfringens]
MKKSLRKIGRFLPTKIVLNIDYLRSYKKKLNLDNPRYYGEKIQWIKLNGNLERYGNYVDKYEVRNYVNEKLGYGYFPELIGVYSNSDEINFKNLPDRFVIKMTNGTGGNIICKDKSKLDILETKNKLNKWQKEKIYKYTKENQYKNVKSKIICEEYLEDETGSLTDYKLHCFDGKVEMIEIHRDRYTDHKENYYDIYWNDYGVSCKVKKGPDMEKPKNLNKMINIAENLSKDFTYVRVDLYSVKGKIYFGELTFTPANGTDPFLPMEKDLYLGTLINLENYH